LEKSFIISECPVKSNRNNVNNYNLCEAVINTMKPGVALSISIQRCDAASKNVQQKSVRHCTAVCKNILQNTALCNS